MDFVSPKLIFLVKSRPAIYKFRSKTDKTRDVLDRLWAEIAVEMDCSEQECRRKWSILRNCFARSLRLEKKNLPNRKPWYMKDEMSFLKNYIQPHNKRKGRYSKKSRSESLSPTEGLIENESSYAIPSNQPFVANEASSCSTISIKSSPIMFTAIDNEPAMEFKQNENQVTDEQPKEEKFPVDGEASNGSTISIKSSPLQFTQNVNEPIIEVHQHQGIIELHDNSNQLFLTSLLPDLNKLSERKQRIFKRKTLELLEILFEEDENITKMEEMYNQHYQGQLPRLN